MKALTPVAASRPDLVNEFAERMYVKAAALSRVHEAIASIGACGAVTPNLDSLVERCFKLQETEAFAPCEATQASSCLMRGQFTVMKLRGLFARPETLNVWPAAALTANAENPALEHFIGNVT